MISGHDLFLATSNPWILTTLKKAFDLDVTGVRLWLCLALTYKLAFSF